VTCDGRLFHRRAAATGNALSPTVDRRVRRTSRDVDEAERSRRLDSVFAGRRSSSRRYVGATSIGVLNIINNNNYNSVIAVAT